MIWKIQKKSKLNSEIIWKLWKKSNMNSEQIWKIQKKSKLNSEKIFQTATFEIQRLKYQLVVFIVHDVIKHLIFPYFFPYLFTIQPTFLHLKRCGLKKFGGNEMFYNVMY
jgi:hypothetical protein